MPIRRWPSFGAEHSSLGGGRHGTARTGLQCRSSIRKICFPVRVPCHARSTAAALECGGLLRRSLWRQTRSQPMAWAECTNVYRPRVKMPNCRHYEKAQTRSGTVQGGIAGGHQIRGGPRGGGVRADRLRERQGALCVPVAGARQDHHADARGTGGREKRAPPARVVVRPSAAEGSPAFGVSGWFLGADPRDVYFLASAQTGSPLSNTIRQVWGASSRQIELNRPTTLSFTITGPVLWARSPDASTST